MSLPLHQQAWGEAGRLISVFGTVYWTNQDSHSDSFLGRSTLLNIICLCLSFLENFYWNNKHNIKIDISPFSRVQFSGIKGIHTCAALTTWLHNCLIISKWSLHPRPMLPTPRAWKPPLLFLWICHVLGIIYEWNNLCLPTTFIIMSERSFEVAAYRIQ